MSTIRLLLLLMVGFCELTVYSMNFRRLFDVGMAIMCRPRDVHVYMNHSNVLFGDKEKVKAISTLGLRGCIVNVVYMKNDIMDQQVIMTHYHPNLLKDHGNELERQLGKIPMDKYSYAHSIVIYPNGRSFLKKNEHDLAREFKKGQKEYLRHELINSRKTYNCLQSVVQEKLKVQKLDMSFIPYVLECGTIHEKWGRASEVYVTLSNELKNPSFCQIDDAYKRRLYCDNILNTKVPMFGINEKQQALLVSVSAQDDAE